MSEWWKSAVVYQIYPRSFADSDGDGVGDLRGILEHLDHLELLGVDVVWLSPVYRSPQDDNGYDISDYEDVDPVFGTLADLDELIAGLHARGIKLMMDLVVNHTSDEHPWFVESRSSTDNPKRDWYWWRPPRPGHQPGVAGAEPTNWQSFFSGSAWEYDEAGGEYYLHLFSPQAARPQLGEPRGPRGVYAMMRRWLERGVDGFRMDVVNLSQQAGRPRRRARGRPGPPGELGDGSGFFLNGPRIHEFLHEMHESVLADRGLVTVGETPGASVGDARLYTDPARREVDMVFTFEHMELDALRAAPSGTSGRSGSRTSRPTSRPGSWGWPTPAGTRSTGTTTTSPAWCPAGATTASTGSRAPRRGRRCSTCSAGRRTSTRARSWA